MDAPPGPQSPFDAKTVAPAHTLVPDLTFDSFRLVQRIGEGGMGEVWLAEQLRPIHRQVVIKVIKAGMDTDHVVARFDAERQALALMNHPAIATVFDAGATPQGRPYFAMEYVRGEPITQYCDVHGLTTRERLELFISVCEGVQHAHQKGIIHRDLKPSNLLVSVQDDRPMPKVIDFGVAKAISQPLVQRTLYTSLGGFVGMPEYMSPEQAEMGGVDVDTRTDVYALGVILYELLTGMLPFDRQLFAGKTYDEIRRTIRDTDPPRPSTRIAQLGPDVARTAGERGIDRARLASSLRGDLDWITMKALEKERSRRYGSASELAADIRRHLTNQPVVAGRPGPGYRARKFVRRHRAGVAAAVGVALLLVGFATAMLVQAQRVARERDRANMEAERASKEATAAKQVSEFLISLFKVSDPREARGDSLTARQVLDRGAQRLETELSQQPELQAQLMYTVATVYGELGLYEEGYRLAQRALDVRRLTLGESHALTFSAHMAVGNALMALNRLQEAESHLRIAADGLSTVLGVASEDTLMSLNNLAVLLFRKGRMSEAETLLGRIVEGRTQLHGSDHPLTISALANRGAAQHALEKWQAAETTYRQVLAYRREKLGSNHPQTLRVLSNLGELSRQLGKFDEAESFFQQALDGRRRVLPPSHVDTAITLSYYGDLRNAQRRYVQGEALLRESVAMHRAVFPKGSPGTWLAESRLGEALAGQRKFQEAERLLLTAADGVEASPELMQLEKRAAIQRLVALYDSWRKPQKMLEWRAKLQN